MSDIILIIDDEVEFAELVGDAVKPACPRRDRTGPDRALGLTIPEVDPANRFAWAASIGAPRDEKSVTLHADWNKRKTSPEAIF